VTDLETGGDLRHHMKTKKDWTEEQAKFIMACTVAGLDYMHTN
jgi:serine/threonine protein kinase